MLFFLPNILFRNSLYFYLLCSYDSRLFSYYCPIILINLLKKISECIIIKQTHSNCHLHEVFSKSALLVLSKIELPLGPGAVEDSVDDAIFRAGLHAQTTPSN